jgi:hypothetical protein
MKTISQTLKEFIDADYPIVKPGGIFSGQDVSDIMSILSGEADNFVIFNNSGGRTFHIRFYEGCGYKSIQAFKDYIEVDKKYIYMYKVEGIETIIKQLTKY